MKTWRKYPVIYEINTWVWLGALSRTHRKPVTLATVPDEKCDGIATYGFHAVWPTLARPIVSAGMSWMRI